MFGNLVIQCLMSNLTNSFKKTNNHLGVRTYAIGVYGNITGGYV